MIKDKSHSKKYRRITGGWLRDERGVTLVMVVVIMLVFTLAATGIAALVLNTTSLVTDSRGNVQSRAAADAGITAAVAAAQRGEDFCDPATFNRVSANPSYTLTTSCTDDQVTFTSVGQGGSGAVTTSVAVYQRQAAAQNEEAMTSDASFFITGTMNNITIVPNPDSHSTPVFFNSGTGTYVCNGVTIPGDLYVAGNFTISAACTIAGSLWVGGNATLVGGSLSIGGSLTVVGNASGSTQLTVGGATHIGGTMDFNGSPKLLTGPVYIHGAGTSNFNGTAGRSDRPLVDFFSNGRLEFVWSSDSRIIYANVLAKNNVTVNGRTIQGSVTLPTSATMSQNSATIVGGVIRSNTVTLPSMPTAPTFPGWLEYVYDHSDWPGYSYRNLAAEAKCSDFGWRSAPGFTLLEAQAAPVVLDARGCSGFGVKAWDVNNPVALKTNIVFLANSFELGGLGLTAASGSSPKVWFVTEGPAQNGMPVCTSAKSAGITVNDVKVHDPVSVLLYTPCNVISSSASTIRGGIYSGGYVPGGQFTLYGRSISLPGWGGSDSPGNGGVNGGNGGSGGNGGTSGSLGLLISQRDSN